MSRYVLLFILNLPFILAGILSIVTKYKIGRATSKKLTAQLVMWFSVLIGLLMAEPLYNWLFSNGLTNTDSLSLFDVIQITSIVILFYLTNRMRFRLESTERRLQDLHQEVSIKLSKK